MRTTGSLIFLPQISSSINILAQLVVACCLVLGGCSALHIHSQLLWVEMDSLCESSHPLCVYPKVDHHSQIREAFPDLCMTWQCSTSSTPSRSPCT